MGISKKTHKQKKPVKVKPIVTFSDNDGNVVHTAVFDTRPMTPAVYDEWYAQNLEGQTFKMQFGVRKF